MWKRLLLVFVLAAGMLTAGFLLRKQYESSYPAALPPKVAANLADLYKEIDDEATRLLRDPVSLQSAAWDDVHHFFIRTNPSGIAGWSHNDYLPDAASLQSPGTHLFLSNQRGEFILKKWPVRDGYLVNVVTLRDRYPISNGFLAPTLNDRIFPVREIGITGPAAAEGDPIRLGGEVLFRLTPVSAESRDSHLSFFLLFGGLLLLGYALFIAQKELEPRWGAEPVALLMLGTFYLLRQGMVRSGVPALYFQSDIFDPRIFASSPVNASLGDLLLNGLFLLILVLYLFRRYAGLRSVRWLLQRSAVVRYAAGMVSLFLALLAVQLSFNFIEVIYHNSTQSLDVVQSLGFSWVRATAFLAVLVGTAAAFLFIHITASLARHLVSSGWPAFLAVMAGAAGLFWLQYYLTGNDNRISLGMGVLMLAGLRVFRFDHLDVSFSFRLLLYLVFSLTVFSIHHSLAIREFQEERLVRDQFRYAKDFLTERDVLGEYLLDQARQRIARDPFIQTRMASPFFSKNSVSEKIRRVHLNRYFDRYELTISTRATTDSLLRVADAWQATPYEGVFYSRTASGEALKRYHVTIPIFYQRAVGTVELELVLKRILPDNVFPELLVDNRFSQLYRNRDFSFAVFRNGQVMNSSGSFPYDRQFDMAWLEDERILGEGVRALGYHHVGIEEGDGSMAVVSAPEYTVNSLVTNISFWFVLGLGLLLTVQAMVGLFALAAGEQFGYTARIQLFMFLAFALPMVTVSVTTLTVMGRSSVEATTREFTQRSGVVAQRLAALLSQEGSEAGRLETWVAENAVYAQTDISVFSPDGRLLATSQPALYENQLVSTLMNRAAYRQVMVDGMLQAVGDERIGSLKFSSAYAAVLSPQTGALQAVVSLPFFESASYLERGQARVFFNILKVFSIVFLVFTFLSFLAADSLAAPIRFMARLLRQTTLSGENKPLQWKTEDEVGRLVQEYNRMVANLAESRRALAQSEKESAWREMAKQVAHEIKNPLTPMKLTLQQLQSESEPGGEKVKKSVEVMLRQVEILNAIASSFSSLARMPALSPHPTDLVALITQTASLFSTAEDGRVVFTAPGGPVRASIDPTALTRALSNVIINALQARKEGQQAMVNVTLTCREGKAMISVEDNGRGIPAPLQERIFQPQFTTKESGSGLGLYMAHQLVVQSGGRIWFTTSDKGTTFFIEIPLMPAEGK